MTATSIYFYNHNYLKPDLYKLASVKLYMELAFCRLKIIEAQNINVLNVYPGRR